VKEYYLYLLGDTSHKFGKIIIDWDEVPLGAAERFATTAKNSQFKPLNINRFLPIKDVNNAFSGRKMVVLGDSISFGFIPRNYTGYPGQLNSYAKLTSEKLQMTFVNYGQSGTTLAENPSSISSSFVNRYDNLDNDADVILVMGGTNDIRKGILLGSFTDSTSETFYGGLHVLCLGLLEKYRNAQGTTIGKEKIIVFCTPIKLGIDITTTYSGNTIGDFANAVKEVCAYYSIPILDLYNLSGINPHIQRTLQGTEVDYTDMYNIYITDGTHPTQEGHEIIEKVLTGFLKTLI